MLGSWFRAAPAPGCWARRVTVRQWCSSQRVATRRQYSTIKKDRTAKEPKDVKPTLGRPGNNLKMGICGLPNTGKSSFFNALTNSAVPAENFPFCTINPNEARVAVPDERLDWLVDFYKPASTIPAYLSVTDIAGLIKGAAEGLGLGNAFLSNIQQVDGLFHLCRGFDSSDVLHVEGRIDPISDLIIIQEELRLKDADSLNRLLELKKKESARAGKNSAKKMEELDVLHKVHEWVVGQKKEVRSGNWSDEEIEVINSLHLLTAKPAVFLCNISEKDFIRMSNPWMPVLKGYLGQNHPDDLLIPFSGELETTLAAMNKIQQNTYLTALSNKYDAPKLAKSALPDITFAGYDALNLQYFFTGGPDEVRAWTIRANTKAPQAASVIHSDLEKSFVLAEVMSYDDLRSYGSEASVKNAGKYVQKGRDYVVQDGDIICK
ncbi:P-loop containing nucleoside triphosphate hydrolase protein [Fimicolochytrium jonesii]|uniref:P-loop containing nucleoside triphosphate hydrolase protein n=1 Tax=Fimicolochytrium jonesii TaxID=1396493 RepID=UPI0022FF4605|nr:P-loop containing nucleoside triphosphate hydrolase protein [Fimicolochytrium jonesii]KAI8818581.1 P-loop containing nucleoside triphosphate hydrolase protein [Fimicolochytrium jonesii]